MCQLVATLIHLFLCRYECRKFGFWGTFLAGRFCVYITQMNFLFLPLFILFCSFYCFVLLFLIRAICPIVFCAYCQPGRGGVTFDTLVNVPRYHVAALFALCVPSGGVVLSCFAVEVVAVVGASIGDTGSVPLTLLS